MRIAALWVPDFPLQALRRSQPELAEAPLVIAAGPSPHDLVVAVAAEAAELGARRGMTAAQARQVAPRTLVRVTPVATLAAAEEALADVAAGFSPRIKRHDAGEALLDVGGLVPRFGDEQAIAHELLRACRHVGLESHVGVASCVGVARVAARAGEVMVVRAEQESAFMAALPVRLLEPAPALVETLSHWGIHAAGELARLPRHEVALRLGPEGVALHRLACGEETGTFIPDPLKEALREGVELDFPLGTIEQFMFVANGILSRLEKRLELCGEGFAEVLFELRLEGGGRRDYRLKLVAPTREVAAVLAMARLQLEATPPDAPAEGVVAQVTPGRVRLLQGSLFGPPLPAPGKLSMTLARLAALVGPGRVGAPAVPDVHRFAHQAMATTFEAIIKDFYARALQLHERHAILIFVGDAGGLAVLARNWELNDRACRRDAPDLPGAEFGEPEVVVGANRYAARLGARCREQRTLCHRTQVVWIEPTDAVATRLCEPQIPV
jgi:hypothetical protein